MNNLLQVYKNHATSHNNILLRLGPPRELFSISMYPMRRMPGAEECKRRISVELKAIEDGHYRLVNSYTVPGLCGQSRYEMEAEQGLYEMYAAWW